MDLVPIYRRLVGARIRADWQYRASFVFFTVSQFLGTSLDFAVIAVIFGQVDRLAGWSGAEIAFLYGTSALAFALSDVFVSEVERTSFHIRNGSFDQFLIRPLGPLFQMCCHEFALRRAGKMIQAGTILAIAMVLVDVDWSPARLAGVAAMLTSGFVIFGGMWVTTASLSFWTVNTSEVANAFTYGGNYAAQYPLEIFSGWLRRVLTIVPLAFVNYYPALWVLGRRDPTGLPGAARFASPVVAVVVVLVARAVWTSGVRHYRSTGS